MLTTVKGHFEDGRIILTEVPVVHKSEVLVTFLEENKTSLKKERIPGRLKGKISISDDFNDPLTEDLKDYM